MTRLNGVKGIRNRWVHHIFLPFRASLENRYLRALRDGFTLALPLLIFGSVGTLINLFPFDSYQLVKSSIFNGYLVITLEYIDKFTLKAIALFVLAGTSFSLADSFSSREDDVVFVRIILPVLATISSFFSFNALFYGYLLVFPADSVVIISAMIIAILSTRLFIFFRDLPYFKKFAWFQDGNSTITQFTRHVLPFVMVMLFFALLKRMINREGFRNGYMILTTQIGDRFLIQEQISYLTSFIFSFSRNALWFLGVNGSILFNAFIIEQYNDSRLGDGALLSVLFSNSFTNAFIYFGGAGTTLGLVLASIINGKKSQIYRVCLLGLIPSIFNINEVIVFGLPIVLNPFLAIPFLLVPSILFVVNFIMLQFLPLSITNSTISWTTPIFLSGYLTTGSIIGTALQFFNLSVSVLIYLPFIKIYDSFQSRRFSQHRGELVEQSTVRITVTQNYFHLRNDDVGIIARLLSSEIMTAIKVGDLTVCYKPLVDYRRKKVINFESFVEWRHPRQGLIPTEVIVALASDSKHAKDFVLWYINTSIDELYRWQKRGDNFGLSMNIPPTEIANTSIANAIITRLESYHLAPHLLAIEVDESMDLSTNTEFSKSINRLINFGIRLIIDNFGFGHSCALYIQKFPIRAMKIDKSLIGSIVTNRKSLIVLRGIIDMCRRLNIELLFDHVENHEQLQLLLLEGAYLFQGPVFSTRCCDKEIRHQADNIEKEL